MTLFYQGRCARITDKVFEVWCPFYRVYPIAELRGIRAEWARTPMMALPAVRVATTGIALLAAAVAIAGWSLWHGATVVALGVAVSAGTLSIISWLTRPRPHELRAVYRDSEICLFRTTDNLEFGQVTRALRRVLERIRDNRESLV